MLYTVLCILDQYIEELAPTVVKLYQTLHQERLEISSS